MLNDLKYTRDQVEDSLKNRKYDEVMATYMLLVAKSSKVTENKKKSFFFFYKWQKLIWITRKKCLELLLLFLLSSMEQETQDQVVHYQLKIQWYPGQVN